MQLNKIYKKLNMTVIACPPLYIKLTGSADTAIILAQLMYWFSKKNKFYKTNKDLQQETQISRYCIIEGKKEISKLGFIKITIEGLPSKTYYEIDWGKFQQTITNFIEKLDNTETSTLKTNSCFDGRGLDSELSGNRTAIPIRTNINTNIKKINKEKQSPSVPEEDPSLLSSIFSSESFSSSSELSPVVQIINYLNEKTNKKYKSSTPATIKLIKTRMKEGCSVEDFKKVIDNKILSVQQGKFDEMYLRPSTLFGTKFEGYLNENQEKKKNLHPQLTQHLINYYCKNIIGLSENEKLPDASVNIFISAAARIHRICIQRKVPKSYQNELLWKALEQSKQLLNFKINWLTSDWIYDETILKYLKQTKPKMKKPYKTRVGMRL